MPAVIKKSVKNLFSFAAIKWAKRYLTRDRTYSFSGLKLQVHKDVFHPGLFRSTKVMVNWLNEQELKNKTVLELGCGSGLIALIAAQKGGVTTAVDINPKAVENTTINAANNNLKTTCYSSNLFADIPPTERFDYVLINPPYFPGDPSNDYEHAWYCGKDFSYFHKLFEQIKKRPPRESYYMILSDSCDLTTIARIAKARQLTLNKTYKKKTWGETFFIYKVEESILS